LEEEEVEDEEEKEKIPAVFDLMTF